MTTKALEPQLEPLVLAPFSVGFMVTQNILVDSQVYLNDPYVVLMALSLLLRSLCSYAHHSCCDALTSKG